jgi:hypothetical protein
MSYGIIFWGNSTDSKIVFYIKKKIIRIMAGTKRGASCRELFKKFNILPLANKFLLSLLSFVVDNIETFKTNSDICNINTRYRYNLHVPNTNLSKYQKASNCVDSFYLTQEFCSHFNGSFLCNDNTTFSYILITYLLCLHCMMND